MSDEAPSTPKAATGINALTVRETEILGKAWGCLKTGPPDIDYEKLAKELNMGNPRSASNAWAAIRKKMAWSTTATPATAKSTAAKRKKSVASKAAVADDSEVDDNNESPAPKKKKAAAAKPKSTPRKKLPSKSNKPTKSGATVAEASEESENDGAADEPQVKAEAEVDEENADGEVA